MGSIFIFRASRPYCSAHERLRDIGAPPQRSARGRRGSSDRRPCGRMYGWTRRRRDFDQDLCRDARRCPRTGHRQERRGCAAPGPATRARPHRFPGQPVQIDHGPRDRPRVALTFHGQGDPAIARAVLAEAERAHARITVLAVGSWLDEHPDMARRILDGGHDLGNHTQSHVDISAMGEAAAYAEITGCAQRLRRLTGSIGTWFRPSRSRYATPLVQRLARRAGYPHVLSYDVDSSTSPLQAPRPSPERSPGSSATDRW